MDLQNYVKELALSQGALAVGYTKIRKTAPVMVLAFPFSDKWVLNHPFYIARRFREELLSSWGLQKQICKLLNKEGYSAIAKTSLSVFGDFRPLAVAAGLGTWGKNGLVVNKLHGSHLLFSAIFTDAPFTTTEHAAESELCSGCNECTSACPANAFRKQIFSAKRCFPYAIRGCSQCIQVCQGTSYPPLQYH